MDALWHDLAVLERGWYDGSGEQVTPDTLNHTKTIVEQLAPHRPLISPSLRGDITVECKHYGFTVDGHDVHLWFPDPYDHHFDARKPEDVTALVTKIKACLK